MSFIMVPKISWALKGNPIVLKVQPQRGQISVQVASFPSTVMGMVTAFAKITVQTRTEKKNKRKEKKVMSIHLTPCVLQVLHQKHDCPSKRNPLH